MTVKRLIARGRIHRGYISPDAAVSTATDRLHAAKVGALVVSSDGQHLEGIITEHDIVRGLALHGSRVLMLTVSDLMTEEVKSCLVSDSVLSVMHKMTYLRIRHIPVQNAAGKFEGLIAVEDVISDRLEVVPARSEQLRDTISGKAA